MTLNYQNPTPQLIAAVWVKASPIPGYDHNVWRSDAFGNSIKYLDYGNRDSQFGWEIDHIVPSSKGGGDSLSNLRPLHWKANSTLGGLLRR